MAYEGETLYACPVNFLCGGAAEAVVVSGAALNPCGHMLLHSGGRYFHVALPYGYPKYMDQRQFERYLQENHKHEVRRTRLQLRDVAAAQRKLEQLLASKWLWGLLPHNCASFVEEIVAAGGGHEGLYGNCPASMEVFR